MGTHVKLLFLFVLLMVPINTSCNAQVSTEPTYPALSETNTRIMTPSPPPAIDITDTGTPLPPLPTLPPDDARKKIQELMTTNGECRLPCWWNIVPGEAYFSEASYSLNEFLIDSSEFYGSSQYGGPTKINKLKAYDYYYQDDGPFEGAYGTVMLFSENDLVVALILEGYQQMSLSYSLQDMLLNYGTPEEVWVYTLRDSYGEDVLPFVIALDYSNLGFIAYYEGNGQPVYEKGTNRLCYDEIDNPPVLILWDPLYGNPIASNNIDYLYRIWSELKPLETATGMTKEGLLNAITQANSDNKGICLDTPSDLWEY